MKSGLVVLTAAQIRSGQATADGLDLGGHDVQCPVSFVGRDLAGEGRVDVVASTRGGPGVLEEGHGAVAEIKRGKAAKTTGCLGVQRPNSPMKP